MRSKYKLTPEGKRVLGYFVVGAVANGVIDPLLGEWAYNNPSVPKSPLEPYITTNDAIQLAVNAGVFLTGFLMDKEPLVWIGAGMLAEKVGMKTTLWIWNVLHPGRPAWGLSQSFPQNNAVHTRYTPPMQYSGSKYRIAA